MATGHRAMVEPNTIIDGRYRVLSRLGSGGMADVYLAEDQLLGRSLAVKVLHHHFAEDQEFVERFRREASSAAGLSHPNIVGIFDRGEWDGTYYIAMEYVPGRSLKALVREQGPLDPVVAIDIVTQILQAARFAHARGVIHRDLKPHNVILDEEGRARVTDFGIAQAGASDMTLTGSIMGTAQYLSPEQAQGHAVSAASDLYCGRGDPVRAADRRRPVRRRHGRGDRVQAGLRTAARRRARPTRRSPPCSTRSCCARSPRTRPRATASAEEFIAALRSRAPAAAGRPPRPPSSPTGHLEAPGTATHVVPAAAALSTGVPPAALLLPPDGGSLGEHRRTSRTSRPPKDAGICAWPIAVAVAAAIVALVLVLALTRPSSGGHVTVPSVAGQSEAVASAALRHAGLVPVPALTANSTVAERCRDRRDAAPRAASSARARA